MTKSTFAGLSIVAASIASFFFSVSAQAYEGDAAPVASSAATRAEVKAELQRARLAGELDQRGESYGFFDPGSVTSTRDRSEVRAEIAVARAAGELDMHRDYTDPFRHVRGVSTTTRAEVMAEYQRARKAGEIRHGVLYGSFAPVPYMSRQQIAAREQALLRARTAATTARAPD